MMGLLVDHQAACSLGSRHAGLGPGPQYRSSLNAPYGKLSMSSQASKQEELLSDCYFSS